MTTITNQKLHEIVRQIEAEWDQAGLSGEGNLYADLAVLTAQRAIALAEIDADERYVAGAVDARGAMAQIWEDALNDASWPEEITKIPEVRALFERTKSRKKDWVLIAADAYEAGFGKGQQAAARGIEIENPWSDEPGREAWALGYGTGKGRYRPPAAATPTDDYAAESDTAELASNSALPRPLMLAQRLEKTAQWPLHLAAADELRRMHAQVAVAQRVSEFNVGRWCLSEDECIAQGIDFSAYERGVDDAANAFGKNVAAAPLPAVVQVPQGVDVEGRRIAAEAENHACSLAVWMTRMDAESPDADDLGVSGWLQEAEKRIKRRMLAAAPEAPALPAVVPQGWKTLFADSVEALAKEVDAGWSPEARTQVYRLESAARMMRMELAAPEAPALPADVREALKGLKCVPPKDMASINWRLAYKQGWSAGIDAALARLDALGGGE